LLLIRPSRDGSGGALCHFRTQSQQPAPRIPVPSSGPTAVGPLKRGSLDTYKSKPTRPYRLPPVDTWARTPLTPRRKRAERLKTQKAAAAAAGGLGWPRAPPAPAGHYSFPRRGLRRRSQRPHGPGAMRGRWLSDPTAARRRHSRRSEPPSPGLFGGWAGPLTYHGVGVSGGAEGKRDGDDDGDRIRIVGDVVRFLPSSIYFLLHFQPFFLFLYAGSRCAWGRDFFLKKKSWYG